MDHPPLIFSLFVVYMLLLVEGNCTTFILMGWVDGVADLLQCPLRLTNCEHRKEIHPSSVAGT